MINIYKTQYKYFRSGIIYVQNWRVCELSKCILAIQKQLTNRPQVITNQTNHRWTFGTLEAKMKNKFVSPYPDRPCQNRLTEKNLLEICRYFFFSRFVQNSLCWKFRILDSFRQKIDIFALPSTSLSSKKKKPTYLPTYLPTSKIVGRVRGNRNIFNCGLKNLEISKYKRFFSLERPWNI